MQVCVSQSRLFFAHFYLYNQYETTSLLDCFWVVSLRFLKGRSCFFFSSWMAWNRKFLTSDESVFISLGSGKARLDLNFLYHCPKRPVITPIRVVRFYPVSMRPKVKWIRSLLASSSFCLTSFVRDERLSLSKLSCESFFLWLTIPERSDMVQFFFCICTCLS